MKSFVKERNDLKVHHQIHISYDKEVNNGSTAKESNEDVSIDQIMKYVQFFGGWREFSFSKKLNSWKSINY